MLHLVAPALKNKNSNEMPHSDTLNYYLERLSPICISEMRKKMIKNRQYDHEYKVQAVKLVKELGIPKNTMYGWMRANNLGNFDLGANFQIPQSTMTLNEEFIWLR